MEDSFFFLRMSTATTTSAATTGTSVKTMTKYLPVLLLGLPPKTVVNRLRTYTKDHQRFPSYHRESVMFYSQL